VSDSRLIVSRENRALNALRAVAALLVVVGHARAYLFVARDEAPNDPITQGILAILSMEHGAVLVFFVLSGYFVGGSSLRTMASRKFSWKGYGVSRLVRLWLVLVPAIVLTLALDWIGRTWLGASPRYSAASDAVANTDLATVVGNMFFLQPIYVEVLGSNRALWSVSYEFAYYAAFPLLLVGFAFAKSWRSRVVCLAAGGAVLVFFGWGVAALFPVWLLGGLVAFYQDRIMEALRKVPYVLLLAARLVCVVLTLATMVADKVAGGSPTTTPPTSYAVAVSAALLTALLLPDVHPRYKITDGLLTFTSKMAHSSFSLYAIHLPILSLIAVALSPNQVTGSWQPTAVSWLAFVGVICVLVAAGWLFAQGTERHTDAVRRWVNARTDRRWAVLRPRPVHAESAPVRGSD